MVDQQDGLGSCGVAAVAGEAPGVPEQGLAVVRQTHDQGTLVHPVAAGIPMGAPGEGGNLIQEGGRPGDDRGTALRVVALPPGEDSLVRDHVRAIEGIVEATPAGIGGVEGIAGVADRDHELGPGDPGDLRVDICGGDAEVRPLRDQIPDVGEESAIGPGVDGLSPVRPMPGIDLRLKRVPPGQERRIPGPELGDDGGEGPPESIGVDPRSWGYLVLYEVVQGLGHLEAARVHAFGHDLVLLTPSRRGPVSGGRWYADPRLR